ncbi:hypothetical protein MIR68_008728 [Amoeboaphelidium protococcarum]|nr:hypothetical protein MIR68_008728 [Amoeboaphelidium protococcarum]
MMYGRPKPPVPKINDRRRGKAAKKRKRELRKYIGKFSPPDKPPVIALGDAGVKHVRGNPPAPQAALIMSCRSYWEHEVVMRCRHKKAKKILPGRLRAQTVCIKADGPEILSHEVLIFLTEESNQDLEFAQTAKTLDVTSLQIGTLMLTGVWLKQSAITRCMVADLNGNAAPKGAPDIYSNVCRTNR